jgi:hypothetical protein
MKLSLKQRTHNRPDGSDRTGRRNYRPDRLIAQKRSRAAHGVHGPLEPAQHRPDFSISELDQIIDLDHQISRNNDQSN